jgi:purine-cytosine permease-like protein
MASTTTDRAGAIEAAGVEYLPEAARDSSPRNLSAVFLGANLTWTNVVFGAFAIMFGLSFWQTLTSMAVGIAIGTLAVLPTAIIGPRTGTNMTVSSGAFRDPRPLHRFRVGLGDRAGLRRGDGVDQR